MTYHKDFSPANAFAIAPDTFTIDDSKARVDFLKFSKEDGAGLIVAGFLISATAASLDELKSAPALEMVPLYRWNGKKMWSINDNIQDEFMVYRMLDDVYRNAFDSNAFNEPRLELLSVSYEGWYGFKL